AATSTRRRGVTGEAPEILDALYGRISFDRPIASLLGDPAVQRLRHVRLSNIDSINMPGISGLTRFEHVVGAGYIASHVSFAAHLRSLDRMAIVASALLHDWAITSYGHLVEEALQYA